MRIKPLGIFIVVAIIAALAYFAFKSGFSDGKETSTEQTTNTSGGNQSQNNTPPSATKPSSNAEEREFNYSPEKPENGSLLFWVG